MARLSGFNSLFSSKVITSLLPGVDSDTIYTVPNNFEAEITLIMITNAGPLANISLQIYNKDLNVYSFLYRVKGVSANNSDNVLGASILYLNEGDKILAHKDGGTFDVSVSGRHVYNPLRS
tara:strand:+ start:737 stop:1099 length:363 start_codon:yes stop_codon:yes gene_type:complete